LGFRDRPPLVIKQPALTVILFSLVSWVLYRISLNLEPELQRLALIASRTSLFLVNFGFWVGSLWGDSFGDKHYGHSQPPDLPAGFFSVVWAIALIMTGTWAARENRRWVVNLVAVFGAIHFYTSTSRPWVPHPVASSPPVWPRSQLPWRCSGTTVAMPRARARAAITPQPTTPVRRATGLPGGWWR
jgi:hypothetical protein